MWLAHCIVEGVILGNALGRIARPPILRLMAPRLAILATGFDPDFYLRQFAGDRAQRVARGPLLHYALLGWLLGRSPAPCFDPAFYRRNNPGMPAAIDPLFHYLTVARQRGAPRNEIEARGEPPPWRQASPAVLVFNHGRGGGSSRFLDGYEGSLAESGHNVLRVRIVPKTRALAVVDGVTVDLAKGQDALVDFARQRGVTRLLVNHLVDRPPEMMTWVQTLAAELGVPYEVVLHDYYVLCPRIDMVKGDATFCDIAPAEACVGCVTRYGAEVQQFDPRSWRRNHLAFLENARQIVVPSRDLATRLQPYLKSPISIWQPEDDAALPAERAPSLSTSEPLRIVTLGALSVAKGLRVVQALAEAAESVEAPLSVSVLGAAAEALPPSVEVRGPYRPGDLDRMIEQAAPHVVFLPAIWPETWSFALSDALRNRLPVVAFDIGAPADRLRSLGRGHIWPLAMSKDPRRLLAAFLELRERWVR
jgi:glycosyltransferase involved in cell wall biosynthesis